MTRSLLYLLLLSLPHTLNTSGLNSGADPSVLVRVSAPNVVERKSDFVVRTTVVNTGTQTLWLLKHPDGVLRPSRSDTFVIKGPGGRFPKFTGVKMKYSPISAAARNDGNTRVVLAPGEEVTVNHDLIRAYNVAPLGSGQYDIRLRDLGRTFYTVDPQTREVSLTKATVIHDSFRTNVSGDFVVASGDAEETSRRPHTRRALMAGCTPAQMNTIQATIPIAASYVNASQEFVEKNFGSREAAVYTKWFGTYDFHRSIITTTFRRMSDNQLGSFTYNCDAFAPDCTDPDDIAYIGPEIFGVINVCPLFFSETVPLAGYDSRASTLVHGASHFNHNGAMNDVAYGVRESLALARRDPESAVSNACNYEYYSIDAFSSPLDTASEDEHPRQEFLGA